MKVTKKINWFSLTFLFLGLGFYSYVSKAATDEDYFENEKPRSEMSHHPENPKTSISLMSGVANTEGPRYSAAYQWGVGVSRVLVGPIAAGVEVGSYKKDPGEADPTLTRTKLLGKISYNINPDEGINPYAGVGLGPVWDRLSGESTTVDLGFVPFIGFDVPLTGKSDSPASLGADASYAFIYGGKPDVVAVNGKVKFSF